MLADHLQEIVGELLQLRRPDAGDERETRTILGHGVRHLLKRPVAEDHVGWNIPGSGQLEP